LNRISLAAPQIRFLIVTGFTGLNLLLGLMALFYASQDLFPLAAACLLACVILDACDGSLARKWEVSSPFGAQLDSLADFTSFCIGSAALAYYWFSPEAPFYLIAGASSFYVFTGAVRLARFNVTADPLSPPQYFQGMPTTSVSAVVAIVYLTCPHLSSTWGVPLVILLGLLMVSVFPYPKVCRLLRLPMWFWAVVALAAAVNLSWTAWVLAAAYMLSGPIIWAKRRCSEPGA
jgi:CDP-diacylglycerol--serine O-phosphatidyltransferase